MSWLFETNKQKEERLFQNRKKAQNDVKKQIFALERKINTINFEKEKLMQLARHCVTQNNFDEQRMHVNSYVTAESHRQKLFAIKNQMQQQSYRYDEYMLLNQQQSFLKTANKVTNDLVAQINLPTITEENANMMENAEKLEMTRETLDDALNESFQNNDMINGEKKEDLVNEICEKLKDDHTFFNMPDVPNNIQYNKSKSSLHSDRKIIDELISKKL